MNILESVTGKVRIYSIAVLAGFDPRSPPAASARRWVCSPSGVTTSFFTDDFLRFAETTSRHERRRVDM